MPVTKMKIKTRRPFAVGKSFEGTGAYEQLDGIVHLAIDPENAANETIADLELAPCDASGLVTFSSDFRVLRPVDPQRGNRRTLFDIPNQNSDRPTPVSTITWILPKRRNLVGVSIMFLVTAQYTRILERVTRGGKAPTNHSVTNRLCG